MKAQVVNPPQPATPTPVVTRGDATRPRTPRDPVRIRLIELLTDHPDVAVIDTPGGGTHLHHATLLELVNIIAADRGLETLILDRATDGAA